MAQYNIEINRYNGNSFDQLYPQIDSSKLEGQMPIVQGGSGSNTLAPQISDQKLRLIHGGTGESPSGGNLPNGEVYVGYGATKSMYIGDNSTKKKINNIYIGVNGKAKLFYSK